MFTDKDNPAIIEIAALIEKFEYALAFERLEQLFVIAVVEPTDVDEIIEAVNDNLKIASGRSDKWTDNPILKPYKLPETPEDFVTVIEKIAADSAAWESPGRGYYYSISRDNIRSRIKTRETRTSYGIRQVVTDYNLCFTVWNKRPFISHNGKDRFYVSFQTMQFEME